MKHFFHLYLHELRMQLLSPAMYIAATVFLVLMAFIYAITLNDASKSVQTLLLAEQFYKGFSIPVLFIVPLLTMKTIAEERRLGTLEAVMTTSVNEFEMVLSKFFGCYTFYLLLWAVTLLFPFVVNIVLPIEGLLVYLFDVRTLIGSYSFIAVSGSLYVAIGLFSSCLTRSQLVAGMLCFLILFFVIMISFFVIKLPVAELNMLALVEEPLDYIRAFKHLEDFSRGVIDSRPFFLYLSTTAMLLWVTSLIVASKV